MGFLVYNAAFVYVEFALLGLCLLFKSYDGINAFILLQLVVSMVVLCVESLLYWSLFVSFEIPLQIRRCLYAKNVPLPVEVVILCAESLMKWISK